MLFKVSDDWKQMLNAEDEARLNELLKKTAKHRPAYRSSRDIKNAQLWTALVELMKENRALQNRLRRLEDVLEGAKERIRKQEEHEKELIESLERF